MPSDSSVSIFAVFAGRLPRVIFLRFRGDASVPNGLKVTWQSEPQLPEADVIALLALGRTREESAAASSGGSFGFGGEASNLLINQALNSTVNSRLQRLF